MAGGTGEPRPSGQKLRPPDCLSHEVQRVSSLRAEPDPLSHFDQPSNPGPRLGLARLGFGLAALALGLQCANLVLFLLAQSIRFAELRGLLLDPNWDLLIGTPITWGALTASLLLLGVRGPGRWPARAGVLCVLNAFDLLLWLADHGGALRPELAALRDPWIGYVLGVFQWFELLLFGSLALSLARHLGDEQGAEHRSSALAFSLVGLGLWGLGLVSCTVWNGWPPRFVIVSLEMYLLLAGARLLLALTAFQVTILCLRAARHARRAGPGGLPTGTDLDLLRPQDDPGFGPTQSPEHDPWS